MIKRLFSPEKLSTLLLILMVGLIIYFIQTRSSAVDDSREALLETQQALAADLRHLEQLEKLEREGPAFLQRLELFDRIIPEKTSSFELELYLYESARSSGITDINVRFAAEKSFDDYVELPMNLTLERTTYHDLLRFLGMLQGGEKVFRVDNLDLYSEDSPAGRLDAYIKLSTFYRN